jgi:FMN phosphatase YigB (HAD superfamily)
MPSAFFKNVDWNRVEHIGFDMDGTLYDEFQFISQAYLKIAKSFSGSDAYPYMTKRWLEKGSSFPKIFDETYEKFSKQLVHPAKKSVFIEESLHTFRNVKPNLTISPRTRHILEFFKNRYSLFLVSDGQLQLQQRKFSALGLESFFNTSNVVFTGINARLFEKPSIASLSLIDSNPKASVFFGDRETDHMFAKNCGMQFQKVYNMFEVPKT